MDQLYTTTEAAEALNRPLPTLRLWIRQGRIPTVRLGKRLMIKKSVLTKIIDGGLDAVEPETLGR